MAVSLLSVPLVGNAAFTESDVVLWYELDETSGVRYDESSNGYDLTDNNTVGYDTGVASNAAFLQSANTEYLSYTTPTGVPTGSAARTYCAWYKGTAAGVVLNQGDDSGVRTEASMYVTTDQLGFLIDGGNVYYTATGILNGNWHHLCIAHAGGVLSAANTVAYMDNSALSVASSNYQTPATYDTNFYIGRNTGGNYLNGYVDIVSVFDVDIGSDGVDDLYTGTSTYATLFGTTSTTSTSTTSSTVDVDELKWTVELYLSWFMFMFMTYIGYRFAKIFV